MQRSVSCSLACEVLSAASVELQVAVARPHVVVEDLQVALDGVPQTTRELSTAVGGRLHLLRCGAGRLTISYRAQVQGRVDPPPVQALDVSHYLRPSRYAESDRLVGFAAAELAGIGPDEIVSAVAAWVGTRLSYVPGSSGATDGAVDTLLAGTGVCRDYAHLAVALLRARDVPARLVAVYAPGLSPMDFHAVVEALVDGCWQVVDATLLAPRGTLVRISTGRDAADTAFLSSYGGAVRLDSVEVSAVVDSDLPADDLTVPVSLG